MDNSLAALVIGSERISTIPLVYSKLMEAMGHHRSSVGDVSSIISQDAGLSARLLRIVNSAFFGFPRKIDTVSRAVQMVGIEQVRDLLLATSVMDSFETVPDNLVSMESFWMHSVGCGVAARAIASCCKEPNIERFFVAGILHDIGRLIIFDRLPEKTMDIMNYMERTGELMYRAERAILGFDHAAVGSALINSWRLPPSLEEIIADHHKPTVANLYRKDTTIVHFADVIAHAMKLGSSGERYVPNINEDAWKYLDLSLDILPQLFDVVDRQTNEVYDKFLLNP
ncbi:MAG: HDOD domain-containing protein [Ignavibacteriales bacterium]|nr:HDOD domain-containing protein [Ignavibacteriales bacterium]